MLLLAWTSVFYAMEAKKIKEEEVDAKSINTCRSLILDDALEELISFDGSPKYAAADNGQCEHIMYTVTLDSKINAQVEKRCTRLISIYTLEFTKNIILLETIYRPAEHLIHPSTPRGKLIAERRKTHPTKYSCEIENDEKKKLSLGYTYNSDGSLAYALFKALFTQEEAKVVLDGILATRQNESYADQSRVSKNFKENLAYIKKLLEYKDE